MIKQVEIDGVSTLGVFSLVTETYALLPRTVERSIVSTYEETLGVKAHRAYLCGSPLVGAFAAGNSRGLLVPKIVFEHELESLREELDVEVEILPTRFTAIGNNIASNDRFSLVNPDIEKPLLRIIEDVLDTEIIRCTISGMKTLGTLAVLTNKGLLVHPDIREDELSFLEESLGLKVGGSTVNGGVPYVGAAMVANSRGALVGPETTGPELARIEEVLDLR